MPNKRYKAELIVTLLRQIEVGIANGKTAPQVCKEAEITVQTYYRWRKEYGGLKLDQAKRLKELEKENAKLKRVVAELSLEKQVLKDIAEGTSKPSATSLCGGACAGEARTLGTTSRISVGVRVGAVKKGKNGSRFLVSDTR
jgi:putative transposase